MKEIIYLYIKTHNQTGLRYFGKTTQDPFKYKGSGKYWKRHLEKHGYDVSTEILGAFQDIVLCKETAIRFSQENDIVKSSKWANLKIEELDGGWNHITDEIIKHRCTKQKEAWKIHHSRIQEKEYRKSNEYRFQQAKQTHLIHTPFGIFPSMALTRKQLDIGDFGTLKRWLNGVVLTQGAFNRVKNKSLFSLSDVGKNTNDIGWYYLPTTFPKA